MTLILLKILLLLVLLKGSINAYRLCRILYFQKIYRAYTEKKFKDEKGYIIFEKQCEIQELFEKSKISKPSITVMQPVGTRHEQPREIDVFSSMAHINTANIVNYMIIAFKQSIGVYKKRLKEAFNPFYWLDTIIFLPQKISEYIGINQNSGSIGIVIKTINVIYWIIMFLFSILKNDVLRNFFMTIFQ